MGERVVRTREELKDAIDQDAERIIVKGELAEKLNIGLGIANASKITLALLVGAIGMVPFTGGLSVVAAAPIAVITGLQIAVIIAVAFIGIALILAIIKNYNKIKFTVRAAGNEAELILEKA